MKRFGILELQNPARNRVTQNDFELLTQIFLQKFFF